MKETPMSNCEKQFSLELLQNKERMDDRDAFQYRNIEVYFGKDLGFCQIKLGKTVIIAQVTGTIVEPKASRPHEGNLIINLELSPMANPAFEAGRTSAKGVEMNRLLERCFKESRCVDLESLCIIADQQVWEIRVDLTALNHDGNILDACSIATITALAHYRRPDVSVHDGKITIHPPDEKAYIPLSVLHMPICTSFSFYTFGQSVQGHKHMVLDATYLEEAVMDGQMVVAMNKHREICALKMTGNHLLMKDQVKHCTQISAHNVLLITGMILEALIEDQKRRDEKSPDFSQLAAELSTHMQDTDFEMEDADTSDLTKVAEINKLIKEAGLLDRPESDDDDIQKLTPEKTESKNKSAGSELGGGGASTWLDDDDTKNATVKSKKKPRTVKKRSKLKQAGDDSDSEEDEVIVLNLG